MYFREEGKKEGESKESGRDGSGFRERDIER